MNSTLTKIFAPIQKVQLLLRLLLNGSLLILAFFGATAKADPPHQSVQINFGELKNRFELLKFTEIDNTQFLSFGNDQKTDFTQNSFLKVMPIDSDKNLMSCNEFNAFSDARERALADISKSLSEVSDKLKNATEQINQGESVDENLALLSELEAIKQKVLKAETEFPVSLLANPDRILRYSWNLKPSFISTGKIISWELKSFAPSILVIPGYKWEQQGDITEISGVKSAPFVLGNAVVFERQASVGSFCGGGSKVKLLGTVNFELNMETESLHGCSIMNEDCVATQSRSIRTQTISNPVALGNL